MITITVCGFLLFTHVLSANCVCACCAGSGVDRPLNFLFFGEFGRHQFASLHVRCFRPFPCDWHRTLVIDVVQLILEPFSYVVRFRICGRQSYGKHFFFSFGGEGFSKMFAINLNSFDFDGMTASVVQ